jgi:F-type H+-transporting ATPase subunit b
MIYFLFSFFLTHEEESLISFNPNILETNLINILLLLALLFYAYTTSFRSTLETRQSEILQSIENLQKDLKIAKNYYNGAEKAFSQSLFWLTSWKKKYQKERINLLTTKYKQIEQGLKDSFLTSEILIKNFEEKSFLSLQKYILLVTISKILRKFFFLSQKEQSQLIELTLKKLGKVSEEKNEHY